jgi:transcriptional regulator with XRE-family HTH domain
MCRLIRALRRKQGLTQETLAEKAGLDYKYYQRLELGRTEAPMLATLDRLSRALHTKSWVLLCDEPALILKKTGLSAAAIRPVTARPGRPKKTPRRNLHI